MCSFSVTPRSFLKLVQSGPSLEETALYFLSTSGFDPNATCSVPARARGDRNSTGYSAAAAHRHRTLRRPRHRDLHCSSYSLG